MSTDTDKKRKALLQAYPGYSWHEKVASWPSEQVVAVFLRFERDGWPKTEPKLNPDLKPEDDVCPRHGTPLQRGRCSRCLSGIDDNDDQLPLF